jgi:hypothetical protein
VLADERTTVKKMDESKALLDVSEPEKQSAARRVAWLLIVGFLNVFFGEMLFGVSPFSILFRL